MTNYLEEFNRILLGTIVTNAREQTIPYDTSIEQVTSLFIARAREGVNKLMFVGNGGSAGIVSHQVFDYWKNGRLRTICFNDPASLTGSANDFGYPNVFAGPIAVFAQSGDVLIAISSSGQSANIVNAAIEARKRGCAVMTLSGFSEGNPLRRLGDWNFYVPSSHYGFVEVAHLVLCHSILDYIITHKTPEASARRIVGLGEVINGSSATSTPPVQHHIDA